MRISEVYIVIPHQGIQEILMCIYKEVNFAGGNIIMAGVCIYIAGPILVVLIVHHTMCQ